MEFISALSAIVVIDVALAGDNAIVIALAARNLPRHLQTRAMIWGAAGAILVRTVMTIVVVWLLKIPGLLFAGGVMLLWIAHKLLRPNLANAGDDKIEAASTFYGAIRTIIAADMVMGLDNMLAVAGAAHGSTLVVGLGLLISIPIVVGGSTILLKFIERFPAIVYLGAGVLAVTAARMIISEPYIADMMAAYESGAPIIYAGAVLAVLGNGLINNHRRLESSIDEKLRACAQSVDANSLPQPAAGGGNTMSKVLVPVDRSDNSQAAVRHVIRQMRAGRAGEIHLLNVQPPFSRHISQFLGRKSRLGHHHEEVRKVFRPVEQMLDRAGARYVLHSAVGDKAALITETARALACDRIVMSTARKNSLTRMLENSVTHKVLEATPVPVEVIAGNAVSPAERYGLPLSIGTMLMLLLFTVAS